MENQAIGGQMLAETVPGKVLPRVLKRFDLVTIYFVIVFSSYGSAQMAASGWASIPMLILATVGFLLPCALASYELGTLFPSEGGVYVWAHKTFGALHGFIAGWLSWVPVFLVIPGEALIVSTHLQYIFGAAWGVVATTIVQLVFVWLIFAVTTSKLRFSQSTVNTLFFFALGTVVVALIAGLMHGHPVNPVTSDIFSFDLGKWGFLYSAAAFWLVGVEIPYNMSAEYPDHKRTGKTMLIWGSIALIIGYFMGIVGILWSTPIAGIDQITGVARAVATISPTLGIIIAVTTCLGVFASGTTTMNAYSRLLFIGGVEKKLPDQMAHISTNNKTPWPAMLVQAIGSSVVVLIFSIFVHSAVSYNLFLASITAIWCGSLFYIYFALLKTRAEYRELYEKEKDNIWHVPGGKFGVTVCCVVGIIFNFLAVYYVFAKPWVDGISERDWTTTLGVICLVTIIVGAIVFFIGDSKKNAA